MGVSATGQTRLATPLRTVSPDSVDFGVRALKGADLKMLFIRGLIGKEAATV